MDLYLSAEIQLLSDLITLQENIIDNNLEKTQETVEAINNNYALTEDQEKKILSLYEGLLESDFFQQITENEKGLDSIFYTLNNLIFFKDMNKNYIFLKIKILDNLQKSLNANELEEKRQISDWIKEEGIILFDYYNDDPDNYSDFLFLAKLLLSLTLKIKDFDTSKIIRAKLNEVLTQGE